MPVCGRIGKLFINNQKLDHVQNNFEFSYGWHVAGILWIS